MMPKLSAEELKRLLLANALDVLDLRSVSDFLAGFIPGSINLPSDEENFTGNLRKIWPHPREVVVLISGESMVPTDVLSFVQEIGGAVKGYASFENWKRAEYHTLTLETIKIDKLLKNQSAFELVDVRTEEEWLKKHIHGSRNIPLSKLNVLAHELDTAKKYVVFCAGVYRGVAGAAKLRAKGFDVRYLPGGVSTWEEKGGTTEEVRS
ncbi:rhodanese-like domain-containing protein [Alicyclobacillus curvatus]|nr:rhodanese-like domain-containing protein [Alicyclobacillus curvatus]